MNNTRKIGIGFLLSAVITCIISNTLTLNVWLAKKLCGDMYNIEPDPVLRAQDILTESACGFDSDLYFVAFIFLLMICGVSLLLISLKK